MHTNLRKGIIDIIYFISATLLIQYLAIMWTHWYLYEFNVPHEDKMITNPVFILFVSGSMLAIEKWLRPKVCGSGNEKERFVTFTSGRKKVSIETGNIRYIESRDTEVLVWTTREEPYPTRMKISQWDTVLDDRFVRVHRSFIVYTRYITRFDSRSVSLGETIIEISRKYRDSAAKQFRAHGQHKI